MTFDYLRQMPPPCRDTLPPTPCRHATLSMMLFLRFDTPLYAERRAIAATPLRHTPLCLLLPPITRCRHIIITLSLIMR